MRHTLLALPLTAVLAACSSATPPSVQLPTPSPSAGIRSLGLMEVTLTGVGTSHMSAQALPYHPGVQSQALTDLSGGLQLKYDSNGYSDRNGMRYAWATFRVRNAAANGTPYASAQQNLTLLAVSTGNPSTATIADTAVRNLKHFDGSAYTDPLKTTLARSFVPTQKLDTSGNLNVVEQGADLQLLPESAVADGQFSAPDSTPVSYTDLGVNTVLPYGFVVRTPASDGTAQGRTLPDLTGDARPVAQQYDGLVTIAVKVPLQTPATDNPYTFSLVFEVVSDPTTRVTQSVEEQNTAGNAAVSQRASTLGASVITTLPGSTLPTSSNVSALDVQCTVRTAGSAGAPTAVFPALAAPALGEVLTLSGTTACLPGGTSGNAEYTVVPLNSSSSSAKSVSVLARNSVSVTGPPTPNLIGDDAGPQLGLGDGGLPAAPTSPATDSDLARLTQDQQTLTPKLANPAARVAQGIHPLSLPTGTLALGDTVSLNVAPGCSGAVDLRTGTVRSIGAHLIIVSDTNNPAGGFTTTQLDSFVTDFDTNTWPTITGAFGTPTDIDNNGHVVAFVTRAVNELSPPASSTVTYGYSETRDLFNTDPTSGCERSNQGELFYMLTPDPTGAVNSNVRTVANVQSYFQPTLAHEFQHVINASRRMYVNNAVSFEVPWLNEGLSNIAEELMFYATSVGLTPRQNIVVSNINTGPNASKRVAAFNTYANPNFGRYRPFLQRPDNFGPFWTTDSLGARGATWNFLRYAADRYVLAGGTEGGPGGFLYQLVNSQTTGLTNLQAVIGVDPYSWAQDWSVANYADDIGVNPLAIYTHPSWNYRSLFGALGGFPLLARPLTAGTPLNLTYQRGGSTSYLRMGVISGQTAQLLLYPTVNGSSDAVSVKVVRTK
ncbi:hypothetical protein [Deinococcus ruber]|uniref:Uncharacterized protein n=1 Tax=Deinococcus ruber TaxID=1848197 RepID=A0A918FI78_9DEIO|nr:hypothetical protein [Deinococcus ruber]GGR39313.1 hypothetical protein GCM10008957_55250 [Deinococcus ruber]